MMNNKMVEQMMNFYEKYYKQLEGATILRFGGMNADEFNPYDHGFPEFLVRLADGSHTTIEISRDSEGNGGGFIFGLPVPKQE